MGGSKGRARCPHRARPGRGKTLRNLLKPHHGALNSYIQKSDSLAKISERGSVSRSVMAGNDMLNFPGAPCHPELLAVADPRSLGSGFGNGLKKTSRLRWKDRTKAEFLWKTK